MTGNLTAVIEELCVANRILSHEGVLDAFGHVSVRHPTDPNRYFLARSRSPLLIEPDDILEYTLDSEPVKHADVTLYSERVIHGGIYQARSDVMAVCHHHAPAVLPFCVSGKPIVPVFHLGATIGEQTPFWDQADEFGDTNLVGDRARGGAIAGAGARPSLGGDDATSWRDRRGHQSQGTGVALGLSLSERRVSDEGLSARRADAAAPGGDQACG